MKHILTGYWENKDSSDSFDERYEQVVQRLKGHTFVVACKDCLEDGVQVAALGLL